MVYRFACVVFSPAVTKFYECKRWWPRLDVDSPDAAILSKNVIDISFSNIIRKVRYVDKAPFLCSVVAHLVFPAKD